MVGSHTGTFKRTAFSIMVLLLSRLLMATTPFAVLAFGTRLDQCAKVFMPKQSNGGVATGETRGTPELSRSTDPVITLPDLHGLVGQVRGWASTAGDLRLAQACVRRAVISRPGAVGGRGCVVIQPLKW
jgi:hypothetical protein